MRGGTLLKNWPVGAVVLVATGISLAAGAGGGSMTDGSHYPVRVALPAERTPSSATLMRPEGAAPPAPTATATDTTAPAIVSPDFASAFAGIDTPSAAPAPRPSPAATSDSGGVAAVRFNLADPYATGGGGAAPIEVKKSVRVNGADVGDATIRVTDGATIAIARDELGRILSAAGRGDAAEALAKAGTYVTFDRIRQAGLSVRYDAASDRIVLTS